MTSEHDPAIATYQHEKSRPREAEALHMLRKIASLVKPIMRQRGWKVGVLTEFYPQERNLLGLNFNGGDRICLRLRHAADERQFLPLEQVTDTMLHDKHFHNLWNQLRDEYENLIRKGYTGEGFLSTGQKLGGGRIPMHEARRRARVAAEKRRVLSAGSGQRLGGAPVRRGQDIRQVIADAATRRATVMKGCASGTTKEREKEIIEGLDKESVRTKAGADDANEEAIMIAYIDLVQEEEREKYGDAYVPPSKENPAGSRGGPVGKTKAADIAANELSQLKAEQESKNRTPPIPTSTKPPTKAFSTNLTPKPSFASTTTKPLTNPSSTSTSTSTSTSKNTRSTIDLTNPALAPTPISWTCDICTLLNPPTQLFCDACGIERPSPPPSPAVAPPPRNHTSQKQPNHSKPISLRDSNAIKAVRTLKELEEIERQRPKKPLGWLCWCGQFMENEWWTCGSCGKMKELS
ncbi:MAG: hypothetical protein Q9164_006913 [Protoblastenia rupestris]